MTGHRVKARCSDFGLAVVAPFFVSGWIRESCTSPRRSPSLTPFPRAAYAQKIMPHRRQFLQSVTASALAAPWVPSAVSAEDPTGAPSLPNAADPAYWDKLRDHFLLARDKVFFNNGTIGATPLHRHFFSPACQLRTTVNGTPAGVSGTRNKKRLPSGEGCQRGRPRSPVPGGGA